MARQFLRLIMAGGLTGVFFSFVWQPNYFFAWFLILLAAGLLVDYFLTGRKNIYLIMAVVFIVSFSLGQLRAGSFLNRTLIYNPDDQAPVKIYGTIIEPPERRENYLRVIFQPVGMSEKIVAQVDLFTELNYGDEVIFTGIIHRPENFITHTGKEFNYISYLAVRGIYHQLSVSEATVISRGRWSGIKNSLFSLKNALVEKLNNLLPEPESSLAAGILLGVKESLGRNLENDFRRTGIIHIIVLSGYNITIIASSVARVLAWLPWRVTLSGSAVSIILFAIMVGGGATVVRASLMALIAVLAAATGRLYDAATALFIAGFIMILHNPGILFHDLSFQLSFLATLGLIYFSPIILPYVRWLPKCLAIREVAATTLAAQVFVLPWILYQIGEISVVAPLVNILIVPLVPLAMLLSFLAGATAFISPIIALLISYLAFGPLTYIIRVVEFFANWPQAAITVSKTPLILVLAFYFFFWWLIRKKFFPQQNLISDKPVL